MPVVESNPPKTKIESGRRSGSGDLGNAGAAPIVGGEGRSAPKLCDAGTQVKEIKAANAQKRIRGTKNYFKKTQFTYYHWTATIWQRFTVA